MKDGILNWDIEFRGRKLSLPVYRKHTVIIGTGAASLAAAERLSRQGIDDLLILTDNLKGGTSLNTGSDKQTYYKLDDSGRDPDTPFEMAESLSAGGCMHGDIALIEAQNSLNCFYHLVSLGVDFPHNRFGGYTGYKTDHDPRCRGVSLGPHTSREMHRALLREVESRDIPLADHRDAQLILTDGDRAVGVLVLNTRDLDSPCRGLEVYLAENIVLGVGGPGGLYDTSVYPQAQRGGIAIALEAGAEAVNLTESQFGIASIRFRWNLSGSFQQVLPCYYSTDREGGDRQYFLSDYFSSTEEMCHAQFLKGYQWPFDPHKVRNQGSSLIDILVYREREVKMRRVFMDFRINPEKVKGSSFYLEEQHQEVLDYLSSGEVQGNTPYDRLENLNPASIQLYRDHGIDLANEPLEIAVCAQHNNGGLAADIWWESSNIRHLFPVGEVNGSHGIYRPGGSALNAGQVGALRASEKIAKVYNKMTLQAESLKAGILDTVLRRMALLEDLLQEGADQQDVFAYRKDFQKRMTRSAGVIRSAGDIDQACRRAWEQWRQFRDCKVPARELIPYAMKNRQLSLTHCLYLESVRDYLKKGGGSRGSFLVLDGKGLESHPALGEDWHYLDEKAELKREMQTLRYKGDQSVSITSVPCRPVPEESFWFETMWRDYQNKQIY